MAWPSPPRASVFLHSGLNFKRNMLARTFIPHRLLSRQTFEQFALDFLWCGNGYLEKRENMLRSTLRPAARPGEVHAARRGSRDLSTRCAAGEMSTNSSAGRCTTCARPTSTRRSTACPSGCRRCRAALLNESATLFRRKYYNNGSHAGFILYMTDTAQNETDVDGAAQALKSRKGTGQFPQPVHVRPGGKKDGMQLIPVSEVAAKDEFGSIKNISRDDMLAALRIPPQLMGIVPQNAGGFGSIREAAQVWGFNELEPLQARLQRSTSGSARR